MVRGTIGVIATVGGVTVSDEIVETGDHPNVYGDGVDNIALTAGKLATAWVMTNNSVAACNLTNGHGYTTGKHDFFWTTATVAKAKYDVDVTVSTDSLTMANGVGDAYPANGVADVVCTEVQQINTAIDGDECQMFVLHSTSVASVYFESAASASIAQFDLAADTPYTWTQSSGVTNPLTGDPITVCFASCGSNSAAGVLTIMSLEDSTP